MPAASKNLLRPAIQYLLIVIKQGTVHHLPFGIGRIHDHAVSGIDAHIGILPDVLLLPATFLAIPAGALVLGHGWLATLSGCLLGGGSFWLLSVLYRRFRGRDGLGLGDAKLMALLGALAGPLALPSIMFMGALLALTFVLISQHTPKTPLPFGPWLSISFFLHTLLPRITL